MPNNAPRVVLVKAIVPGAAPVCVESSLVRVDEPTRAQAAAGRYPKRTMPWKGLTIRIENEAGSVRRGTKPDGTPWETRMAFPYGEIARTEGVDGDPVDVFIGPFAETADTVFVVHQRRVGDWKRFDEDKCMVGWLTEADARDAFLSCYDDPRFLGPITAMPVDEFIEKARATRTVPRMIKAVRVGPYIRRGKLVNLHGYDRLAGQGRAVDGQLSLLDALEKPPAPVRQTETEAFKKWFGDSKVVDADGKPLVVCHGTKADFDTFDASKNERLPGFWMAPQADRASGYAQNTTGSNVMPLYVSLQKPRIYVVEKEPYTKAWDDYEAGDYDGFIMVAKGEMQAVVARHPNQIKSATGNNGEFSRESNVITKSIGAGSGDAPILFLKAKLKGDDRTADMFSAPAATHIETHTRKDGVVQTYHVASKKKVRVPLEGVHTELTLNDGSVHRILRLNSVESMGLPGWHTMEGAAHSSYLADTEDEAIRFLIDQHAKKAEKKDAALTAAIDHLKEDSVQKDIPAAEKKEDAALVAKLEEARGDQSEKKLGAKAVRALEILRAGGYFRKQLESQYRGGEKFETRLRDKSGSVISGIGIKTFFELQDAGHLSSRQVERSTVYPSEWVARDKPLTAAPKVTKVEANDSAPGIWLDDVQRDRLRDDGVRWANKEKGEYGSKFMRENLAGYFEDHWHVPKKFTQTEIDKWFPAEVAPEDDHPAPIPRQSIKYLNDVDRDKWINLHRQQHEARYKDLEKVKRDLEGARSKRNKAETTYNEAASEHGKSVDAKKKGWPGGERADEFAAWANKANDEYRKHRDAVDRLSNKHAALHSDIAKLGAAKEKLLPGSGDIQFDMTSQRRRTEDEEVKHAKEQAKLYKKAPAILTKSIAPRVTLIRRIS